MITQSDIDRIQTLPEGESVLMAVVHVDHDNHGGALTTRVKSALNDLGVPPTLEGRLLDDVPRAREARGKSAVYVLGEGVDERLMYLADWFVRPDSYAAGLAELVNFQSKLPLAAL